jgi:hypothetical protein
MAERSLKRGPRRVRGDRMGEVNGRPASCACPLCGRAAKLLPRSSPYSEYECLACGPYRIDERTGLEIDVGDFNPRRTGRIYEGRGSRWLVKVGFNPKR